MTKVWTDLAHVVTLPQQVSSLRATVAGFVQHSIERHCSYKLLPFDPQTRCVFYPTADTSVSQAVQLTLGDTFGRNEQKLTQAAIRVNTFGAAGFERLVHYEHRFTGIRVPLVRGCQPLQQSANNEDIQWSVTLSTFDTTNYVAETHQHLRGKIRAISPRSYGVIWREWGSHG